MCATAKAIKPKLQPSAFMHLRGYCITINTAHFAYAVDNKIEIIIDFIRLPAKNLQRNAIIH